MSNKYIYLFFLCFFCFEMSAQVFNDTCEGALPIITGTTCNGGSNSEAETDIGDVCVENSVKDVWFLYNPVANTTVSVKVDLEGQDSLFNDVLSIYEGACGNLTEIDCRNYDEYGFEGEKVFFEVIAGQAYYIKVSGQEKNFGNSSGVFCLETTWETDTSTSPSNEHCGTAEYLPINEDWLESNNENAETEGAYADVLQRSRADVWYEFVPEYGANVNISVNANFSHILALYSGDCTELTLEEKELQGFELNTTNLNAGESYYIQISGRFATLEGDFQIKIEDNSSIAIPPNDLCANAIPIEPNGECMAFDNTNGTFSGIRPSCSFYPGSDVWYQYTAPLEGSTDLKINTAADFMHNVAVYEGGCADTLEIMCSLTPEPCEGYLTLTNLTPGQTYFIQIVSNTNYFSDVSGMGCLEIIRIEQGDNFLPLNLEVSQICSNEESAQLNINVSGGQGEYTITGYTAGNILAEGETFYVQVSDEVGCTQVATGIISCEADNDCGLFYNIISEDASCSEESDGWATILVLPADSDITNTYLWEDGSSYINQNNLLAGKHYVTITSVIAATGEVCADTVLLVEINEPPAINGEYIATPASSISSADGSATILPIGGTPPYSYQWGTGQTTQTISGVPSGTYSFTVEDVNGCGYWDIAEITIDTFCVEYRNLTEIIPVGTNKTFAASDLIVSSSFISPQSNIEYTAGNKIRLVAGFRAAMAADFHARIEDCSANDFVSLEATAILAGAYDVNEGLMRDDLRIAGLLPLTEPYSDMGFEIINTGGEMVNPEVFDVTGENAIVDWIFLELRDRLDNSTILAARPALLCRNGHIVDTDGSSAVTFDDVPAGDYYVSIRHRNHLGLMTAISVGLSNEPMVLDFSSIDTPTWGTNACDTQNGINRMWCGDMNNDGQIIYQGAASDLLPVTTQIYTNSENTDYQASYPSIGYSISDSNLDGQTIYQGANSDLLPVTISVYSNPANAEFQASFPVFEQLPE